MKCDMWSLGVITYILLTGFPPFSGKTNKDIYKNVLRGNIHYLMKEWGHIPIAMDFVQHLILYDAEQRFTAA